MHVSKGRLHLTQVRISIVSLVLGDDVLVLGIAASNKVGRFPLILILGLHDENYIPNPLGF
jgi:hypothetical protein